MNTPVRGGEEGEEEEEEDSRPDVSSRQEGGASRACRHEGQAEVEKIQDSSE